MQTLRIHVETFLRLFGDERGATSIEYAMIAAGIAVAVVTAINSLGGSVSAMFATVLAALG
jgi:pilus assembly protein Flp/PilA